MKLLQNSVYEFRASKSLFRFPIAILISASLTIGLPIFFVTQLNFTEKIAVAAAMALAFVVNFFVNKYFVFESFRNGNKQLAEFLIANFSIRLIDYLGFLLFFQFFEFHYIASLMFVLPATTLVRFYVFNYIFSRK